jgi:hypothetical protein
MSSWMLIFVAYLVPAVIGLPLLFLWDSLSRRRRLAPCRTTKPVQTVPSRSSLRANERKNPHMSQQRQWWTVLWTGLMIFAALTLESPI